jgi:hypothetical protein
LQIKTREGDSPIYLATFGILNSPTVSLDVLKDLVKAGIMYTEKTTDLVGSH